MGEKRVMPVRWAKVELGGEYDGWWAKARINLPWPIYYQALNAAMLISSISTDDPSSMKEGMEAFAQMIPFVKAALIGGEWNFVDEQGKELPLTEDSIASLPWDLVMELYGAISAKMGELPPKPNAS